MDIYIAICCDRHIDDDIEVFTDPDEAIEYAKNSVLESWDIREQPLTKNMQENGWIYLADYGTEDDYVRVEKTQLNPPTRRTNPNHLKRENNLQSSASGV